MWTLIVPLVMGEAHTEYRAEFKTQQHCLEARERMVAPVSAAARRVYSTDDPWENARLRFAEIDRIDQPPGYAVEWGYVNLGVGYCVRSLFEPSAR